MLQTNAQQGATHYYASAIINFFKLNLTRGIIGKPNSSEHILKSRVKTWSNKKESKQKAMLYTSGAQTFWLVGHICLSETLRGPQELKISIQIL